jgi:hypothetical protein
MARWQEVSEALEEMKRQLVKQEKTINKRFGRRPRVGVLRGTAVPTK